MATDKRQEAIKVLSEMISPELAEMMANAEQSDGFGAHLATMALDNVYAELWTRPGLGRRERSFVTLGVLIALHATNEMGLHLQSAIKNGITKDELAEVIYHCAAYAGFPAASAARTVAANFLSDMAESALTPLLD